MTDTISQKSEEDRKKSSSISAKFRPLDPPSASDSWYTDPQKSAMLEIFESHDDRGAGLLCVSAVRDSQTGKVSKEVNAHWQAGSINPKDGEGKRLPVWAFIPPLPEWRFKPWMERADGIFGFVPSQYRLAIVDLDNKSDRALESTIAHFGDPISLYSAANGGFHLIYGVPDWDSAMQIRSGSFTVGGERMGEIGCAYRMINAWEPISILKAVKASLSYMETGKPISMLDVDKIEWTQTEQFEHDKKPKHKSDYKGDKLTTEDFAEGLGLNWNGKVYRGHCPLCAARGEAPGGSTRFQLKDINGEPFMTCWQCAPQGVGYKNFVWLVSEVRANLNLKLINSILDEEE